MCKVQLRGRSGDEDAADFREQPSSAESSGAEKEASFLGSLTWVDMACGFCCTSSLCHRSARMLSS